MTKPIVPVPERRKILPLGPREVSTFPIASWDVRKTMSEKGKLIPLAEVVPESRLDEIPFVRNDLGKLLWWEHDEAIYNIFMNPKEMVEDALRLNDATKAMIFGKADDITPWRILASPRISQVMDTDTALAKKFIEALEPSDVSMGRGLRAAADFAADPSAAYGIITAFGNGVTRSVCQRPNNDPKGPVTRHAVDLGDLKSLRTIYSRIKDIPLERLLRSSYIKNGYGQLWSFVNASVNRRFVIMTEEAREHLERQARGEA